MVGVMWFGCTACAYNAVDSRVGCLSKTESGFRLNSLNTHREDSYIIAGSHYPDARRTGTLDRCDLVVHLGDRGSSAA